MGGRRCEMTVESKSISVIDLADRDRSLLLLLKNARVDGADDDEACDYEGDGHGGY